MGRTYNYAQNKEYQQTYQRERYERLIAEGRCVMCTGPKDDDPHRYCRKCRAYYNQKQKARYHAKKEVRANG